MHRHTIALAVADATRSAAVAPPRSHGRHRLAPVLAGLVATAALVPASALAMPARDVARPGSAPVAAVAKSDGAAGDGFDWVDAGLGAGLTGALLVGAAGVASARRHPAMMARRSR